MAEVRGSAAVLRVIDAERIALREELRFLDEIYRQVRAALSGKLEPTAGGGDRRRKSRRKAKGSAARRTPADAAKRERDILRFLLEHGPSQAGEIRDAVPGAGEKAQLSALRRLMDKGLIRKKGPRQRPTYEALDAPRGGGSDDAPQPETLGGQILALIEENDGSSAAELVAHTGASLEEVQIECRQLIDEGEIKLERRGDTVVYVLQVGA
jgi:hypothetical protein